MQRIEKFGDARDDRVFEDALPFVVLAVKSDGASGFFLRHAVKFRKGRKERRPDERFEFCPVPLLDAAFAEGIEDGIGDAFEGFGERPVEVEEDVFDHSILCENIQFLFYTQNRIDFIRT